MNGREVVLSCVVVLTLRADAWGEGPSPDGLATGNGAPNAAAGGRLWHAWGSRAGWGTTYINNTVIVTVRAIATPCAKHSK